MAKEEELQDDLASALKDFGSKVKPKGDVGFDVSGMQHEHAFGQGKAAEKLTKLINSKKFSEKKLVKAVDKLVDSWGAGLDSSEKKQYKENILEAAGDLAEEAGKIKNSNIILAEKLANDMLKTFKVQEKAKDGKTVEQSERDLISKENDKFKKFKNKDGRVEFKDAKAVQAFIKQMPKQEGVTKENITFVEANRQAMETLSKDNPIDTNVIGQAVDKQVLNSIKAEIIERTGSKVYNKKNPMPEQFNEGISSITKQIKYNAKIRIPIEKKGVKAEAARIGKKMLAKMAQTKVGKGVAEVANKVKGAMSR